MYADAPFLTAVAVVFSYAVLIFFGTIADWLRAHGFIKVQGVNELEKQKNFVPLS
ncbi:hypothetical protein AB6A40_011696, partial [Gnathostoma spinigerum]